MLKYKQLKVNGKRLEALCINLQEKNFIPTIYDDENYEFKVVKPQLHGSHIVYNVQGVDKQGPFEGVRRYNHFHCLYEAL